MTWGPFKEENSKQQNKADCLLQGIIACLKSFD